MASTWRSWRVRKALDRSAPVPPVSPPHSASLGGALKRVSELAHPAKQVASQHAGAARPPYPGTCINGQVSKCQTKYCPNGILI